MHPTTASLWVDWLDCLVIWYHSLYQCVRIQSSRHTDYSPLNPRSIYLATLLPPLSYETVGLNDADITARLAFDGKLDLGLLCILKQDGFHDDHSFLASPYSL
jgi:hypothetical protein